jgi:hypothetical protein
MRPITEEKREHVYSEAPLEPESSQGVQKTRQNVKSVLFGVLFSEVLSAVFPPKTFVLELCRVCKPLQNKDLTKNGKS